MALTLPESVRSFHDYFDLKAPTDEVVEALGYRLIVERLTLPECAKTPGWVAPLRRRLERTLPHVSLDSEAARRELLIAPVLTEVVTALDGRLRIEYAIDAGAQLHGALDYLLLVRSKLLVVEAKQADTSRGMTQLAAELAALDALTDAEQTVLFGALSTGTLWHFARLDRAAKTLTQDVHTFRVPDDLPALARALVGILQAR